MAFYNDIYALKSIVNLIINQTKALKAHNVSELNLLLTAMRAIVMVCSSKEELNLKTSVSKFVKFIEERDKIDTRLTVSEDYFASLINAYNNFKAEIKVTLCTPQIANSEKIIDKIIEIADFIKLFRVFISKSAIMQKRAAHFF